MKKTHLMFAAAILSIGFTACQDKKAETTTTTTTEALNSYVDSVEHLTPVYTTEYWTAIDNGYRERMTQAEKDFASLNEEEKARAEATKKRYEALRSSYELKIKENATAGANMTTTGVSNKQALRDKLFGAGKVGDDMNLGFVTAQNVRSVYHDFVNAVSDNTSIYTKDDWDEIHNLYNALDARKDAVQKDISTGDKLVIDKLKIKYKAIKITN